MEKWKPIKNFEGLYEISTLGRIKSCQRVIKCKNGTFKTIKEKVLKPGNGKYGRNQYTLCKEGKKYTVRGYYIVAQTFLPNPKNYIEVNHKDGNNLNDCLENLEWISTEENIQHGIDNGLFNTYHKRFKNNNLIKRRTKIMMKENSRRVLDYLKSVNGTNVTAADVAAALNLDKRQVDGSFTAAIQRKGLGIRVEAEVELEDGTHEKVKFLKLNDAGMAFDPDASEEEVKA